MLDYDVLSSASKLSMQHSDKACECVAKNKANLATY